MKVVELTYWCRMSYVTCLTVCWLHQLCFRQWTRAISTLRMTQHKASSHVSQMTHFHWLETSTLIKFILNRLYRLKRRPTRSKIKRRNKNENHKKHLLRLKSQQKRLQTSLFRIQPCLVMNKKNLNSKSYSRFQSSRLVFIDFTSQRVSRWNPLNCMQKLSPSQKLVLVTSCLRTLARFSACLHLWTSLHFCVKYVLRLASS